MDMAIYTAIFSLIISVLTLWYTFKTKRYELRFHRRNDILSWYGKVITLLKSIRYKILQNDQSVAESLHELSSLIELGRFFYPNIDKNDNYGSFKPFAFRGYRNIVLECLIYYYDIAKKNNPMRYERHLKILERHFTSFVFQDVNPSQEIQKANALLNTSTTLICLEDFLEKKIESKEMNEIVFRQF